MDRSKGWREIRGSKRTKRVGRGGGVNWRDRRRCGVWARITPVAIKDVRAANSTKDKFPGRYTSIPLNSFFLVLTLPPHCSPPPPRRYISLAREFIFLISLVDVLQRRGLWSLPLYIHKADVALFLLLPLLSFLRPQLPLVPGSILSVLQWRFTDDVWKRPFAFAFENEFENIPRRGKDIKR